MAKCIVCGERFYHQTHYDPAEDCCCGNNLSADLADDYDPQDIQDMRDYWKETEREICGESGGESADDK